MHKGEEGGAEQLDGDTPRVAVSRKSLRNTSDRVSIGEQAKAPLTPAAPQTTQAAQSQEHKPVVSRRQLREGVAQVDGSEPPASAQSNSAAAETENAPVAGKKQKSRRAKPKKAWPRKLLKTFLAIFIVLMLALAALAFWAVTASFAKKGGTVQVPGIEADVVVETDQLGIPTITANSAPDLFLAQGYIHASERFWEMDFRRHLTAGKLSELFGESQIATDKFLRALGWHNIAAQEVASLPAEILQYYEAYAAGVNAYLDQHQGLALSLEYGLLSLQNPGYKPEPWQVVDSVAWLKAMAWDLRSNIEQETDRALLATTINSREMLELYPGYPFDEHPVIVQQDATEAAEQLATAPAARTVAGPQSSSSAAVNMASAPTTESVLQRVEALVGAQAEGIGSNSWVVSGSHTESGKPILANDPHLGAELPSVWMQMQLRCATVSEACQFDVGGFSFAGLPGIVIGHNNDIGWGFTNLTTDVADLYIERIADSKYWKDGQQYDLESREEVIKVAGGDDVVYEVLSTEHGPIVSDLTSEFAQIAADPVFAEPFLTPIRDIPPGEYAVALRWTALDAGTTAQAIFRLNTAQNFNDFRRAAELFDVPAQNLIYADTEGNIGYQTPGRLPIRGEGDGWLPQPGWVGSFDWQGYIPFEELPFAYNPASGYIVTANNAVVDESYPYFLTRDWDYGYRAARIEELLTAKIAESKLTVADMAALQLDNQFVAWPQLVRAYTGLAVSDPDVQNAIDMVLQWDGQNDASSAAAAFANVLWNSVTKALVPNQGLEIPRSEQSRFALLFDNLLDKPGSRWWYMSGSTSPEELLETAAKTAYEELVQLQGQLPEKWNWGKLHALHLQHSTFGSSGNWALEKIFNRGPFEVGGGSGSVNATGWKLDEGYATKTVPSFRMVLDLADWNSSTWQNLTGTSGHVFNKHYIDQAKNWATGEQYLWPFTPEATVASARSVLTLEPAR